MSVAARRLCLAVQVAIGLWAVFLPVRRELLDRGLLPAGRWRSGQGKNLTLFDDGRYELGSVTGRYVLERFPEAPWISVVTLDQAAQTLRLHVRYDERAYRLEDVWKLSGADVDFSRQ